MQITDLYTMLYQLAKVPAMFFLLSLDSTWAHCVPTLTQLLSCMMVDVFAIFDRKHRSRGPSFDPLLND